VNEKIIVDESDRRYEDYGVWGDDLGAMFRLRNDVGMFFKQEYYEEVVKPLFRVDCGVKGCEKTDLDNPMSKKILGEHLRKEHGLVMCDLCVIARRCGF